MAPWILEIGTFKCSITILYSNDHLNYNFSWDDVTCVASSHRYQGDRELELVRQSLREICLEWAEGQPFTVRIWVLRLVGACETVVWNELLIWGP